MTGYRPRCGNNAGTRGRWQSRMRVCGLPFLGTDVWRGRLGTAFIITILLRKCNKTRFGDLDLGALQVAFSGFGTDVWGGGETISYYNLIKKDNAKTHRGDPGAFQVAFSDCGADVWGCPSLITSVLRK